MTRILPASLIALSLCVGFVGAQTVPPATPRFEVASVRPCEQNVPPLTRTGGGASPGSLTINCQTLGALIQIAYVAFADVRLAGDAGRGILGSTPVEGGPSWVNSDRYTITARAAGAVSEATMRGPMMRALLEDRFRLKVRRETYVVAVYELTLANGGPRLERFRDGSCVEIPRPITFPIPEATPGQRYCKVPGLNNGQSFTPEEQRQAFATNANRVMEWEGATIDEFTAAALNAGPFSGLGRRVVNKTGLTGKFNIRFEYAPPRANIPEIAELQAAAGEPTAASIETALQEQLGLKLVSAKAEGQRVVIESVERPSEN